MSVQALTWALEDAPDVPPHLVATLLGLANHADRDGRGAYPSQATLARYARKAERNVRADLRGLETRGLIRRGDQRYTAHLPPDRRPTVWDLAMERRREPAPQPGERGRPHRDDSPSDPSTETGGCTRPPETGGCTVQTGGMHTSARGGMQASGEPSLEPSLEPSSPSPLTEPAPSGADVPEEEAEEAAPQDQTPDPVRVDAATNTTANTEPEPEPEPAEGEHQAAAAALVAEVPGLRATARRDLTARAARCLAAGHGRRVVADECTRDLAGAASVAAVVRHRLDALAAVAPIPDAPEPAPEATSATGVGRPAWCGQCDVGTRLTEDATGRGMRCPECHPSGGRRAPAPRTEPTPAAEDATEPEPAPEPEPADGPGPCTVHRRRVCHQCWSAAKRQRGEREAGEAMARLGAMVGALGAAST